MNTVFEVSFTFPEREEADLADLNRMLGAVALSGLEIRQESGYSAQCSEYSPEEVLLSTTYRAGLDTVTLVCHQQEGEETFHYQLDAVALPHEQALDLEPFRERWQSQHPDQVIRILRIRTGRRCRTYLVAHHRKPELCLP